MPRNYQNVNIRSFVKNTKKDSNLLNWINEDINLLDVALYDVRTLKPDVALGSIDPILYLFNDERVKMAGLSPKSIKKLKAGVTLTKESLNSGIWIGPRTLVGRASVITVAIGLHDTEKNHR